MEETLKTVKRFAEEVKKEGGRAMLNGGYVRDELMGIQSKDIDVEVYYLAPEKLQEVVSRFGKVDAVGESFAVYKLGQDIDISLPRREKKTGTGHKGFTIEGDPFMSFEEACSRRDFTVNAILKDPLTGEIVDPFRGREAVKNKTLRMVSGKTFQEDSLRVLRLAQFASRLGFGIETETGMFAKQTDLSDLPKERVWMELEKLFLKSPKPSVGVRHLFQLGIMAKLFDVKPYVGMSERIDQVLSFSNDLSNGEKLVLFIATLIWNSEDSVLDELGLTSVDGYNVRKKVEEIRAVTFEPTTDYYFHKLSQTVDMKLLSRLEYVFASPYAHEFADTIERLGIEEKPVEPILKGRDLIEMGLEPSPEFGKILEEVYDRQLRGEITTIESAKEFVLALS